MKRIYTGAPAWVDYTYRFFGWLDCQISRFGSWLTGWRYDFLDRHCCCQKCIDRRKAVAA